LVSLTSVSDVGGRLRGGGGQTQKKKYRKPRKFGTLKIAVCTLSSVWLTLKTAIFSVCHTEDSLQMAIFSVHTEDSRFCAIFSVAHTENNNYPLYRHNASKNLRKFRKVLCSSNKSDFQHPHIRILPSD